MTHGPPRVHAHRRYFAHRNKLTNTAFKSLTNSYSRGFTLIDLVLVILILGVLGGLVTPVFHTMVSEARLNEATGEIVSALQYAENLAVRYQRPFSVTADVGENWFKVLDTQYKADPNPHHDYEPPVDAFGVVLNPTDKGWYVRDFDILTTYQGVAITTVPAGGEIAFYPDGHSSSSSSTFVLSFGGEQRTITVNGITGRITVN